MIHIHFAAPDMAQLDQLRCEALVVTFFADERPLRGVGGLLDWRMCGFPSRRMLEGFIAGDPGESVLLSARGRLPLDKVLMVGLGAEEPFTVEDATARLSSVLGALRGMGVRTVAMVLPGRSTERLGAAQAMEALVAALTDDNTPDEIVLLESAEGQRIMAPIVDRERRRARAREFD